MNSSLDLRIGCSLPAAISRACAVLCWRANSLKESTSSSFEIVSGGTKRPVPLMAVLVTPCYPETAGRKLSQQSAKRNPPGFSGALRAAGTAMNDRAMNDESALVLFSGGQDSTTCLAWALARFARVETVGFDYGQRHGSELAARQRLRTRLKSEFPQWESVLGEDHVLPLEVLPAIGGSALFAGSSAETSETLPNGLPASFVPGRNILFLAATAALAYRRNIWNLVGGMCETDFSGYPDCRAESIEALGRALDLGLGARFTIHTPLMHTDKGATWSLAELLGGRPLIDLIIEETVSCYEGNRERRHPWGYGCGTCPACQLRAAGYERYVSE